MRCYKMYHKLHGPLPKNSKTDRMPARIFVCRSAIENKKTILLKMAKELSEKNIDLYTCCEEDVHNALPADSNIKKSSCIPNDLLVKIFGGNLSFKKDTGQRVKHGCGCMVSVDVGSYHLHPCYHNCLFCYANPTSKRKLSKK